MALLKHSPANFLSTSQHHDLLGSVLTVTYPDSAPTTVTYGYNNAGQIEAIPDYVTDFDYSPIDTVGFIGYANGLTTTNTYDPTELYRLTDKVTTDGTNDLQNISYTFDPVGNITAIADTSDTNTAKDATYTYDDLHRLTEAEITNTANSANYDHTFTYGITGNINSKSDVGSYTYANIHPQAVTSDGTNTYTYDNNGSLAGDGTWTHSYDTRNRLIESTDGTSTINYTYDEGRTRLTKSDGTTTTTYVNDYFEKEGAVERLFIFANSIKVATLENGPQTLLLKTPVTPVAASLDESLPTVETASETVEAASEVEMPVAESTESASLEKEVKENQPSESDVVVPSSDSLTTPADVLPTVETLPTPAIPESPVEPTSPTATTLSYPRIIFHHPDHLSGASIDTDESGDIVLVSDYYPYGDQRLEEKTAGYKNDYLFTGQERDEETDLYYYGARYYNPELGRFTSVDQWKGDLSDPQTLNKYAYARNNPFKYVDTSGNTLEIAGSDAFVVQAQADLRKISPYVSVNEDNHVTFDTVQFGKDFVNDEVDNPMGTALLGGLIADDNTVTIGKGAYETGTSNIANIFFDELDSDVTYDPNTSPLLPTFNDDSERVLYKTPPSFIGLAHELIHALHWADGSMTENKMINYTGLDQNTYKADADEVRTVGLDAGQEGNITENSIRAEHNVDERNNY